MLTRLVIIVLGALVLSAVLTPCVLSLLLTFWPDFPHPFSRVFDRVFILVLFVLIWVYRHTFNLSELFAALNLKPRSRAMQHLLLGISLTAVSGFVLLLVLINNGTLAWKDGFASGAETIPALKIARYLFAALVISLIEESFFRVILLRGLLARMSLIYASLISSLIYAVVHFITPVKTFGYQQFSIMAGFNYLSVIFERLTLPGILEGTVGLFLVGMVLCLAISQSRSIYLCIGLHAGWVFLIKMTGMLTDISYAEMIAAGPGRRYFIISQALTWFYLCIFAILVSTIIKRSERIFRQDEIETKDNICDV